MRLNCRPVGLCVLVVFMLIVFLSLGRWQQNRAVEKERIVSHSLERSKQQAEPLSLDRIEYESLRHLPVSVEGEYDDKHQFLLDNQVKNHQVGYNVFTPVKVKGSEESVLIDRGWVAQGLTRQLPPNIDIENIGVQLTGALYVPYGKGFRLGGLDDGEFLWPRVIQFLDFKEMSERLSYDLLPVVIRLSAEAENGFLREWNIVNMGPEKHYGYAVQWYALALAMIVIFMILALKKRNDV